MSNPPSWRDVMSPDLLSRKHNKSNPSLLQMLVMWPSQMCCRGTAPAGQSSGAGAEAAGEFPVHISLHVPVMCRGLEWPCNSDVRPLLQSSVSTSAQYLTISSQSGNFLTMQTTTDREEGSERIG